MRTAQGGPMRDGHVALGNGHQARQAALTGQQIVMAGELARTAYRIADSE